MPTTYRGVAKSNRVGTQHLLAASFKLEFKRDSKKALAEATARYEQMLRETTPENGGSAWLEVSDRNGPRTLRYDVGRATKRAEPSGRVIAGVWEPSK